MLLLAASSRQILHPIAGAMANRSRLLQAGRAAGQRTLFGKEPEIVVEASPATTPMKAASDADPISSTEPAKRGRKSNRKRPTSESELEKEMFENFEHEALGQQGRQAPGGENADDEIPSGQPKAADDSEDGGDSEKNEDDAEVVPSSAEDDTAASSAGVKGDGEDMTLALANSAPKEEVDKEEAASDTKPPYTKGSFVIQAPEIPTPTPHCHRCGMQADPLRHRLSGKSGGCWCCPSCNTKGTQLTRKFGSWPPKSFARMSKDQQQSFFRECREQSISGGQDLEEKVVNTLVTQRLEIEEAATGGKFLPLSVYEKKGFDIKAIEAKTLPSDKEWNKVLGWCYRVPIRSLFSKTIEQQIRSELVQFSQDCRAQKAKKTSAKASRSRSRRRSKSQASRGRSKDKEAKKEKRPDKEEAKKEKRDSNKTRNKEAEKKKKRDRSTSSSKAEEKSTKRDRSKSRKKDNDKKRNRSRSKSIRQKKNRSRSKSVDKKRKRSRSKSKDSRHRNKSKESHDKEQREQERLKQKLQEKLEKEKEKEKEKAARDAVRLATKAVAKVTSLVTLLRTATQDVHFKRVPDFVGPPAKDALYELDSILKESQACLKVRGKGVTLKFDTESLNAAYNTGSEKNALLVKMLDTARRHA